MEISPQEEEEEEGGVLWGPENPAAGHPAMRLSLMVLTLDGCFVDNLAHAHHPRPFSPPLAY